ncbi:hypothetical protein D3C81_2249750 [compost metagenome]
MVDAGEVYDRKTAALSAYRSQFTAAGPDNDYVATPLNQSYLTRVEARDRLLGQKLGLTYAEGFVSLMPHEVNLFV